jgi:PAS domain S-box-containing protein
MQRVALEQQPSDASLAAIAHSSDRDRIFRLLVDSVRDYAIFVLDPKGHVASWNQGAQRIKGYQEHEILGHHFSVFYPPEAITSGWPDHELEVAQAEGRFEDEGWRVRKDGSKFWADVVITALRDSNGELKGFAKVTRDLTERRATEEKIRKLNAELQLRVDELAKSNRELAQQRAENETFVYSASHDIRAPLLNLQGFSQEIKMASDELRSLLTGDTVPEPVRKRAQAILDQGLDESVKYLQTAVQHLSRIVDALLRLSRAGRVVYQLNVVFPTPIIRRILESLSLSIARTGARVTVEELPPVWGDSVALEQLFGNLISNAINYLDPARPGVIHVGALPPIDHLQIYFVRDNGLGMPAGALPNLFRVFERFHSQVSGGEGMGLAIVHRIIQRHNGRIWVESTEGQGTTVYVALPQPQRTHE